MSTRVDLHICPGAPYEMVIAFTGTVTLPASLTAAVTSRAGRHVLDLVVAVDVDAQVVTVTGSPDADLKHGLVEWSAVDSDGDVWLAGQASIDSRWTGQESSTVGPDTTVAVTTQVLTIEGGGVGGGAVDSVNGHTGVVVLGASDVGADASGAAATAVATEVTNRNSAISTAVGAEASARDSAIGAAVTAHEAASDPHPQYQTQTEGDARYLRPTTGTTLTDPDIPAAIARDSEVTSAIAALSTVYQAINANLTTWATKTPPSGTAVGTTDTQTLTNKTLTAPAISSPTGLAKGDVGLGNVDNTSDTSKPVSTATQTALDLKAPLASPALTGTPVAPTAAQGTNTTQLATTAMVQSEVTLLAPKASPTFTGTPAAPTAAQGTNTTQVATTAMVQSEVVLLAPLASPALTGNPTAPTPTVGDNDTSVATTAFVTAAVAAGGGGGSFDLAQNLAFGG